MTKIIIIRWLKVKQLLLFKQATHQVEQIEKYKEWPSEV